MGVYTMSKRLIIGFLIVSLIVLSGCSEEEIKQLEQTQKELEKTQKIVTETEKSQDIYDSVEVGMTMEEVKTILGEPIDKQVMDSGGMKIEMWYYEGMVQISFLNGIVNSKAKY